MKKKTVFSYTYKYLPLLVFGIILTFLTQYLDSFIAIFVGEILAILTKENHVLPKFFHQFIDHSDTYKEILSVTWIFIIIVFIIVVARVLDGLIRSLFASKLQINVSSHFFKHVLRLPKNELVTHPTGDIIQRSISDSETYTKLYEDGLWRFVSVASQLFAICFQMYFLSKLNFIVAIIVSAFVILFGTCFAVFYAKKREEEVSKLYSKVDEESQQSVSNIALVKSYASEENEKKKFGELYDKLSTTNYKLNQSWAIYWLILDIVTIVYECLAVLVVGYLVFNNQLGIGAAASLILLGTSLVNRAGMVVRNISTIVRSSVAITRLNEYLKIEEDFKEDGNLTPLIEGNIEFKNVSMSYADNPGELVLKDISFEVKKGQTIGIVGKSGSGKSTLINLLTRMDEYTKGSIIFDGVELKDINKKYLRDNMGIVNQDSFVFASSIKENLTILTNEKVNLEEFVDKVCLKEDLAKMNNGIDTIVGERGVTLSGGQRQRIAIARSLIKNKNVLILDDSLSALDNNVASSIKNTLRGNTCTTFIISHNLMNVMDADLILVFDDGKIIEKGNHEELLKRGGLYKKVFMLQQNIKEDSYEE